MGTAVQEEWTEEKIIELIREFRAQSILWDPKDPLFHKKALKSRYWEQIGRRLKIQANHCKHKMSVLMSSFRREKSRILNSMKDGESSQPYKCTWFAFKEMSFLLDKENERKRQLTGETLSENGSEDDGPSCLKKTILTHHYSKETKHLQFANKATDCDGLKPRDSEFVETPTTPLQETRLPNHDSIEEIQSFTNFVASKMRKYTESTKNSVQQAICEIIFRADQGFYDKPNFNNPSAVSQVSSNVDHDTIPEKIILKFDESDYSD